jgi:O-antigen/teichoic acid export membrane protein
MSVILNTSGNQHIFAVILGISMIVNIILNFILVPRFDILGASLAIVFSEIFLLICIIPFILKLVDFSWSKIVLTKLIIAMALIFYFIYLIRDWNLFLIIILVLIVYSAILILLKIITISDLKEYSEILFKRSRRIS